MLTASCGARNMVQWSPVSVSPGLSQLSAWWHVDASLGMGRKWERSLGASGVMLSVQLPSVSTDFTSLFHLLSCCHPSCTLILCPGCSCPCVPFTPPHLFPLCSPPASPSISRLSCPTSLTPRTIHLPQCICRQQDGQPGWCFSRYCSHPSTPWCDTAFQPSCLRLGPCGPGLRHPMCAVFLRVSFLPCCGEQSKACLPQQLCPLSVLVLGARAALPNHSAPGNEAELCLAVGCTVCLPGLSSTHTMLRSTRSTAQHHTGATGVQGCPCQQLCKWMGGQYLPCGQQPLLSAPGPWLSMSRRVLGTRFSAARGQVLLPAGRLQITWH